MSETALVYIVIHTFFYTTSYIIEIIYEALETKYTVLIIHFGEVPYTDTAYIEENLSKNELDYLIATIGEREFICWKESDSLDELYFRDISTSADINLIIRIHFKVDTIYFMQR